uniref:SET binding protein 1 n=1 Tax=Tetraodon nigroviridis TaxID=99883 RepID=H3DD81_TETNG
GEGLLEEQEFSIKEASFQEGSLKLKIQTTKRTKKPPKNLENYICPPEIRMTIRPPVGESKGARQGRTGGGTGSGRGQRDEERGPPRKRLRVTTHTEAHTQLKGYHPQTYERQFRMSEQREGGLLPLMGDHASPKHQLRGSLPPALTPQTQHSLVQQFQHAHGHQHQISSDWITSAVSSTSPANPADFDADRDLVGASRSASLDPNQLFLRAAAQSPSPQRAMTPDLQLPVVTDASVLNLTSLSRGRVLQEVSEQLFGNIKRKYGRKDSQRTICNPHGADTPWGRQPEKGSESPTNSEERQKYRQEDAAERFHEEREDGSINPGPQNPKYHTRWTPTELTVDSQVRWTSFEKRRIKTELKKVIEEIKRRERGQIVTSTSDLESALSTNRMKKNSVGYPKTGADALKHRESLQNHISKNNVLANPRRHRVALSPSPSDSASSTASSRPNKGKDRWSYLKAKSHASLTPPQRENRGSPSTLADPPSAFPITPSSPLYTNTDSLTVHMPIKRKRGRPKKQPLLTVETIHEATSTSPPSPLSQECSAGLSRRRKTHPLSSLVQMPSTTASTNSLLLKRGRGNNRPLNKVKLGKMQSILNEIFSGSSQNGTLALKASSAPVNSTMSAMASTIEARLGKQINVSKRGTIYIGKKRGRKPRSESQGSNPPRATREKLPFSVSLSSLYESPAVPLTSSSPSSSASSLRANHCDTAMPSLQPISSLHSKPTGRSFLSGGWKLSPPQLLANSPSRLSEGASVKEATLSPISESHSEETIPSDSGIGTDNNSTSDQTEKGPASRRRYSFDLCGFEAAEAAALEASSRGSRTRCERQVAAVNSFLSQQEKKQKHHRRKRKCLQSRDHLHFLSELEEVVQKLQQLRISHRRYACFPQHPYPSIFRLNFHHYYPVTYDSYPCDSSSYLRRSADLKAKRRRGRPAKSNEPVTSKLPFVQGYSFPLAGGNYYAAPYAMPYAPPLSLGYFPPAPPFYLPHHSLGPAPPSPFMRPAVPPPKAFHPSGHSKLQPGAKLRSSSGPVQGPTVRGEGLGSLSGSGVGGLGGVRLHKRKHKHKHKHKDEPLLSLRDRQDLGGLFSGAKANAHLSTLRDRRDPGAQDPSKHLQKQRSSGRSSGLASSLGMFPSDQLSTHSLVDSQFHSRQTRQPINSFMGSYSSRSKQSDSAPNLFMGTQEESDGRTMKTRHAVFGDQGLQAFQAARQDPGQILYVLSTKPSLPKKHSSLDKVIHPFNNQTKRLAVSHRSFSPISRIAIPPLPSSLVPPADNRIQDRICSSCSGVPNKRRYKRREVEQIQKDVRRMRSLNFEHVQKILRAKRLQRQAKTGNNVIKRRPGRPRKQPIEVPEDGRTLGMPVLERCDELPGRQSSRPGLNPEPPEFSNPDSISATIENVVHRARSVPPL